MTLEQSSAFHEWGSFRCLWRHADVWLLEIVKNQSVLFPAEEAPPELRDLILEQCRKAGVRT